MEDTRAARPSAGKMVLATVGGILLGLAVGAWFLVGLVFAIISAGWVGPTVWTWVSLGLAVFPFALLVAWMCRGLGWRPLRRLFGRSVTPLGSSNDR